MTITNRLRSRKAQVAAGAAVLALVGSGLALTGGGSAAADGNEWANGWPTELAAGDDRVLSKRVALRADQVIRFRSRLVRSTFVDTGANGFSPGDYEVFEERLLRNHEQVGRDYVRCMANHRAVMCDGTLATGPGTIEVAGAIPFEQGGIHIAVTGGTGKYRDAAGTLTVRNAPGPRERLIVRLVN